MFLHFPAKGFVALMSHGREINLRVSSAAYTKKKKKRERERIIYADSINDIFGSLEREESRGE